MNQLALAELYAGGPGSGCQGENCGRPKSKLQETLEQVKGLWNEKNVWVKLANYGHPGTIAPFSKEELKYLNSLKPRSECRIGFCFQNAQQIANWNENNDLQYVEGLVTVHGVPIDHAYIEYKGKVYDPTLATYKPDQEPVYGKGSSGKEFPTPDYVGVTVPKNEISKYQMKTGMYSPLSHDYKDEALQKKIWK